MVGRSLLIAVGRVGGAVAVEEDASGWTVLLPRAYSPANVSARRWQDLPREYGAPTTAWRRLKHGGEVGIWERIWRAALAILDRQGQLDWTKAFLDGSFVAAKRGGEQVGLTRKG
jgi:hypothetical protein